MNKNSTRNMSIECGVINEPELNILFLTFRAFAAVKILLPSFLKPFQKARFFGYLVYGKVTRIIKKYIKIEFNYLCFINKNLTYFFKHD